jgi:hypothetical protein
MFHCILAPVQLLVSCGLVLLFLSSSKDLSLYYLCIYMEIYFRVHLTSVLFLGCQRISVGIVKQITHDHPSILRLGIDRQTPLTWCFKQMIVKHCSHDLCSNRIYIVSTSDNEVVNHFLINKLNLRIFLCKVDLIQLQGYTCINVLCLLILGSR